MVRLSYAGRPLMKSEAIRVWEATYLGAAHPPVSSAEDGDAGST